MSLSLTFFCFDPTYKNIIIDTKTVGQIYKKSNHAGLAYQLITLPNFVKIMAISVQENVDINHEPITVPIHIINCFMYFDLLTSVSNNGKFNCIMYIHFFE